MKTEPKICEYLLPFILLEAIHCAPVEWTLPVLKCLADEAAKYTQPLTSSLPGTELIPQSSSSRTTHSSAPHSPCTDTPGNPSLRNSSCLSLGLDDEGKLIVDIGPGKLIKPQGWLAISVYNVGIERLCSVFF